MYRPKAAFILVSFIDLWKQCCDKKAYSKTRLLTLQSILLVEDEQVGSEQERLGSARALKIVQKIIR